MKSSNLAIFVMIDKKDGDNADRIHRYFRLLIYLYVSGKLVFSAGLWYNTDRISRLSDEVVRCQEKQE